MPGSEPFFLYSAAVPLERVTSLATRTASKREFGVVKVHASDGIEGIGFCYVGSAGGELLRAAVELGYGR
jgi:L-alanine-DL-glutamate epimerase-like enolase superfamily enzyme